MPKQNIQQPNSNLYHPESTTMNLIDYAMTKSTICRAISIRTFCRHIKLVESENIVNEWVTYITVGCR